jgi:hypothetical protein
MKLPIEPPVAELPQPGTVHDLYTRLNGPGWRKYLGPTFALRMDIAAALETGRRTLSDVAREYGVSRQFAWKLAREAKACGVVQTVD